MTVDKKDLDLVRNALKKCVIFHISDKTRHGDVLFDFGRANLSDLEDNKKISKYSLAHIKKGLHLFESLSYLPYVNFYKEDGSLIIDTREEFYYDMLSQSGEIKGESIYVSNILCYLEQLNPTNFLNTYIANTLTGRLMNSFIKDFLDENRFIILPERTTTEWKQDIQTWYSTLYGNKISDKKLTSLVAFLPKTREELEKEDFEESR